MHLVHELNIHPAIVAGRVRYERNNYRHLSQWVGNGQVRRHFAMPGTPIPGCVDFYWISREPVVVLRESGRFSRPRQGTSYCYDAQCLRLRSCPNAASGLTRTAKPGTVFSLTLRAVSARGHSLASVVDSVREGRGLSSIGRRGASGRARENADGTIRICLPCCETAQPYARQTRPSRNGTHLWASQRRTREVRMVSRDFCGEGIDPKRPLPTQVIPRPVGEMRSGGTGRRRSPLPRDSSP